MQLEVIGCNSTVNGKDCNSMVMGPLIMTRFSGECFITALYKSEIEAKWNISATYGEKQVCPKVEDVSIRFLQ